MPKLVFVETHQEYQVSAGTEFLTLYKIHPDMPLNFGCTQGSCGVCKIHIGSGQENISPPTKQEKQTLHADCPRDIRLACQCAILGDVHIRPPKNV